MGGDVDEVLVTDLQWDTQYTGAVAAFNAAGRGTFSDEDTETTDDDPNDDIVPGDIDSVSTSVSDGVITVTWDLPDSNDGPDVDGYVVQVSIDDGAWSGVSHTGTDRTVDYTSSPGTTYTFRVAGSSTAGTGGFTESSDVVVAAVVPSVPLNPVFSSTTPTNLTANWTVPDSDGGADISSYKVQVKRDSAEIWTTTDTGDTETSWTGTGYTNGAEYDFRVAAVNSVGTGCLLYTSPSPRDRTRSRMPSSA